MFGVSVKNLNKAERLIFGDSLMTHAMVLTAVTDKVLNTQKTCDYRQKCQHAKRMENWLPCPVAGHSNMYPILYTNIQNDISDTTNL